MILLEILYTILLDNLVLQCKFCKILGLGLGLGLTLEGLKLGLGLELGVRVRVSGARESPCL